MEVNMQQMVKYFLHKVLPSVALSDGKVPRNPALWSYFYGLWSEIQPLTFISMDF